MFHRKKKVIDDRYSQDEYCPVLQVSICTGETTAGFQERKSGKIEGIMLIRTEKDLDTFCRDYHIRKEDLKRVY